MKLAGKITLGTVGTVVAITAGLFTIIEKTPSVIAVVSNVMKAEASEVPDNKILDTTRTMAGNAIIQYENVQHKPRGAK